VVGDLTLDTGLTGEGSLLAEGNIVIKGPLYNRSAYRGENVNDGLIRPNSFAIWANGNLILWGSDFERPPSG